MNHSAEQHYLLYSEAELERVMARMASQCLALFSSVAPPLLVGMLRRGEPLAQRLRQQLQQHWPQAPLPVFGLTLKRYADDLHLLHPETALTDNPALLACDLAGTPVLLVDDVLYQGHSLLRAVSWLAQHGASCIRTAVLVDRGMAHLPIHADVVGLRLQIPDNDVIECHVPPYESSFQVEIWHRPD